MKWSTLGLVGAAGVFGATSADAAESVALYLRANNQDIKGESTQTTLGRADSIECVKLDFAASGGAAGFSTAGVAGGGVASRPVFDDIRCLKRIDKASPLLFKAYVQGQPIQATFKFFRPSARGETQQFYTVEIKSGRIDAIKVAVDATAPSQPLEEVSIAFRDIAFTYTDGGVNASWNLALNANR